MSRPNRLELRISAIPVILALIFASIPIVVGGLALVGGLAVMATPARADTLTGSADVGGTGWYPNQAGLTPQVVGGSNFGKLFTSQVSGQVYAQPLVANSHLLVATDANNIYGLDPVSGAQQWTRNLGTAWRSSDVGCADLSPTMGVTGTPVIDAATGTEYMVDETYLNGVDGTPAFYFHAIDISTGAERPGYPLLIEGSAQNNPADTFDPSAEGERGQLLLMGNVVYAGFGAHCDRGPWKGWIVGASTWKLDQTPRLTTLWTSSAGPNLGARGAGIWSGLNSDGPGRILFASGNGAVAESTSTPVPGNQPSAYLGMSVVRADVQSDGSLKADDFFTPYDALALDSSDQDVGSGSITVLPPAYFGTPQYPHLDIQTGKQGYLYLLNGDHLGGFDESGGGDAVLGRTGPYGGVWGRPGVWPGDGGYVYETSGSGGATEHTGNLRAFKYGLSGAGVPGFSLAGAASDAFGFGSGSPIITSNGTTSGSALLWDVWLPAGNGVGAQLRAYDPVPDATGVLQMVFSSPIGTGSKYSQPGVDGNRLYVGTRDGTVIGFGSPVDNALSATPLSFPTTVVGQSSVVNETFTAGHALTITGISSTNAEFALGSTYSIDGAAPLPLDPATIITLAANQTLTVSVTFAPVPQSPPVGDLNVPPPPAGMQGGQLNVSTSAGNLAFAETATSELATGTLYVSPEVISFDGVAAGSSPVSDTLTASNVGATSITITGDSLPNAPFTVTGLPPNGSVVNPGASLNLAITFTPPTTTGHLTGTFTLDTTGGAASIPITAVASTPPQMQILPEYVDFGTVPTGSSMTRTFTVSNPGGTPLVISKSKPPAAALGFTAATSLAEGTTVPAGQAVTESVTFAATASGQFSDQWYLNGNDGSGLQTVDFHATVSNSTSTTVPPPSAGGWMVNGSAVMSGSSLVLTQSAPNEAGTAFWPTAVRTSSLNIAFDATMGGGSGADGLALVLANPSAGATATSVGALGGGLGFEGINGYAVALDTYQNPVNPSTNFVGLSDGGAGPTKLHWTATDAAVPPLRPGPDHVVVSVSAGQITTTVNGVVALHQSIALPPQVLIGFSGGTGALDDVHSVSNVTISVNTSNATVPPPSAGGWKLNGSATLSGPSLLLTQAMPSEAGTAFWPTPVGSGSLDIAFDATIGGGSGADGLALVLADARSAAPTSVGEAGGGLGFEGVGGYAVALDTHENSVNPSANFVGLTDGGTVPGLIDWIATSSSVPQLRAGPTHVVINVSAGRLTATIDGAAALSHTINLPSDVLVGFSAGTGGLNDVHSVSNVVITVG